MTNTLFLVRPAPKDGGRGLPRSGNSQPVPAPSPAGARPHPPSRDKAGAQVGP